LKKFGEYLEESLAAEVKSEPKTAASREAKRLGLTYVGFGRYANSKGQVSYIVDNDRLIPYKGREEVQSMYSKSLSPSSQKKDAKGKTKPDDTAFYNKALNKRDREDSKIINQKNKEIQVLNQELYNFYNPGMFDQSELDAIEWYTAEGYESVNPYLYKGHDQGATSDHDAMINNTIQALDSAFENTEAPFAYTVYSGLSSRYSPQKLKPGNDYIFRGYVSTSIDFATAIDSFADADWTDSAVVLQVEISKGQRSIYVDPVSSNAGEGETLLPRGSKIKIISGPHQIDDSIVSSNPRGGTIQLFHCKLVEDV
jgi:hypothetical protein